MTSSIRPPTRHGRGHVRSRGRLPALVAAGALTGLVLSGGTFALWSDSDDVPLGQIVAGDLAITLVGDTIWDETSPDVDDPQQGFAPEEFLVRPGDTFAIAQGFTTTLQGDNMLAGVRVDWADPASLPDGVQASYIVESSEGPASQPTDLGDVAELDPVESDNAGHEDEYTVVIDLEFAGDMADRFGDNAEPVLANLGQIVLELDQTRSGEGFQ